MAMTALAPAITRSREIIATKTAEVALKLVPDVSEQTQENRKYFAKFVSVVGVLALMFLLFINTLLAQDAFTLSHLKLEAKMVSDQREAIARQIDNLSSPENLAKSATALGMKPSESPTFLTLNQKASSPESVNNG
jgi:CRISPR/Cas system CMR-associated protein Cmr5 small subunit